MFPPAKFRGVGGVVQVPELGGSQGPRPLPPRPPRPHLIISPGDIIPYHRPPPPVPSKHAPGGAGQHGARIEATTRLGAHPRRDPAIKPRTGRPQSLPKAGEGRERRTEPADNGNVEHAMH